MGGNEAGQPAPLAGGDPAGGDDGDDGDDDEEADEEEDEEEDEPLPPPPPKPAKIVASARRSVAAGCVLDAHAAATCRLWLYVSDGMRLMQLDARSAMRVCVCAASVACLLCVARCWQQLQLVS